MTLPKDFEKSLTEKSDEQLYDMLAHADDYLPEAITAARMELQQRDPSPTKSAQLETRIEAIRTQDLQVAQQPLTWPVRIFIFLLSFGVIQFIFLLIATDVYRSKGYARKSKECWTWMWYGAGFWLTLIIFGRRLPIIFNAYVTIFVAVVLSITAVAAVAWSIRHFKQSPPASSE